MKRTILLALMAAVVILGSCKKESKEDPVTPTPTSDSVKFQLRYYVSTDMIDYTDYDLYITLPGETEKKATLPSPQLLDATIDEEMMKAITFFYGDSAKKVAKDKFKVYVLDYVVKKGTGSLYTDLKLKDTEIPEYIIMVNGFSYMINGKKPDVETSSVSLIPDFKTDSTSFSAHIKRVKKPVSITINR